MIGSRAIRNLLVTAHILVAIFQCLNAESGIYDRIGIITEHGFHGAVPEENIDLFTGNLTLKNLDVNLPGPNGFDLKIWRVYNSKVLKDRLLGSAWGIQQEPYSWVGIGWSMHMGRLHNFNSETPVIEYPDGRWETAYRNIDDYSTFITRDFAKLDTSNWKLYFKDGTVWTFGTSANVNYGSMVTEQVRVVTQITNSFGYSINILYDTSSSPRMSTITDSMGRTVHFIIDSTLKKLNRIDVKNALGSTISYCYTVGRFNGDYYRLDEFDPPELPAVTYEYGNGLTSNWELLAVNTSYGGRMEYEYDEHEFYYETYPLYTKVIKKKKIRFNSNSTFSTWMYSYPSYHNVSTGTVEVDGPSFNTSTTYHAYTASTPWKIGLVKGKSASDNSFSEQYEWISRTMSNTHWYVLNIDMGMVAAPLQSKVTRILYGDADTSEVFLYERAGTLKYGLPTRINTYADAELKSYKKIEYYFESVSSFETKYMLNFLKSEISYSSGGSKVKETSMDYYANGALDSVTRWRNGSTYLTWNYSYSSSNPNLITITIDLPGAGGTETLVYRYGILATLSHPGYTEYTRTISSYDSSILSETNQHGGVSEFTYDDLGRITKIDMPLGFNDIAASWTTNSLTITQSDNTLKKYWDGMGRDIGYEELGDGVTLYYRKNLDAEGKVIAESKGSTDSTLCYNYVLTAAGQITKITDPRGKITTIGMASDKRTVTNANSHSTVFEYTDLPGMVTRLTDPTGKIATYAYDALGRLLCTTFNSSRTQTYAYNGLDQVTSETHPETGEIAYAYNAEGNLGTKTWGGVSTNYIYNTSNQVLTENSGDETITYAYDSHGRISSVSSSQGWFKTGIAHNSFGSITQETVTIPGLSAKTTSYIYNGNNQLKQITYPDGRITSYTNNGLNMPETISFNGTSIVSAVAYGINKQPTSVTVDANSTIFSAVYNSIGGISTAQLKKNGTYLYNANYGHDGVGNIVSLNNSNPVLNASYSYDELNRLVWASYTPSGVGRVNVFGYTYDSYGNMTQAKENSVTVFSQGYNCSNQASGMAYDARGNVISSSLHNYSWDNHNRLNKIVRKVSGATLGTFTYDEKGMRLKADRPILPTITVTNPIGGSGWSQGTKYTITWIKSGNLQELVAVRLRAAGSSENDPAALVIADNAPNSLSFEWSIPDTVPSGDYFIRVRTMDSTVIGDSPIFSIKSTITVASPIEGVTWPQQSTQAINWIKGGTMQETVAIRLRAASSSEDDPAVLAIADGAPNSGNYSWMIPSTVVSGDYFIRVRTDDSTVIGDSPIFSIKPSITITAPTAGATWPQESTQTITWTKGGAMQETMAIRLRAAGSTEEDPAALAIVDGAPNSGSYTWMIPATIASGNYFIRVRTVDSSVIGDSMTFSIGAGSGLRLISPSGNEKWPAGSTQNITWNGGEDIAELKIEYSTDLGSTYQPIADRTPNNGLYAWQIPKAKSNHCLVRISDANGQLAAENSILECDLTFAIKGNETIDSRLSLWLQQPVINHPDSKELIPLLTLSQNKRSGNFKLDLGETSVNLSGILSLFEKPHLIKLQWDIMNGRGTVYFDQKPVIQDAPLLPIEEALFSPHLILKSSEGINALYLDDLKINFLQKGIVSINHAEMGSTPLQLSAAPDTTSTVMLVDDFESYRLDEAVSHGGWTASFVFKEIIPSNGGEHPGPRNGGSEFIIDSQKPISGLYSGFASIPDDTTLILSKPISWPERMPFDVSAKPFEIFTQADETSENTKPTPLTNKPDDLTTEDSNEKEYYGPSAGSSSTLSEYTAAVNESITTYYIYSHDGRLLAEYDSTGTCQKDYIYMGSKLIAEYKPPTTKYYYYTPDQINSTRLITDSSGTVVYSAVSDPFGGLQKQWVNTYQPSLKFSGKERESGSELDYFGIRYYNHQSYRFLAVDPLINKGEALSNPQLWNLYSFCRNNPMTFSDPSGAYDRDVHYFLTKYLALQAGFNKAEAEIIASANQRIDDNPATSANVGSAFNKDFVAQKRRWHFASEERVSEVLRHAFASGDLSKLGEALHCFQDSFFAHKKYLKSTSHFWDSLNLWTDPDNTANDVGMALEMAEQTFNLLNFFWKRNRFKSIDKKYLAEVFANPIAPLRAKMLSEAK